MTTMLQLVLLFDQSKSEPWSNNPHVNAEMAARIMFYFLQSLAVFHICSCVSCLGQD